MKPCTDLTTEPLHKPPSIDVQCANPFVETIVFRAPSFGDVVKFLPSLQANLSSKLNSCTPNNLGLVYSNDDAYLNVDIRACPVNQKRFNYSQVLNCFNLTLQTYKPPEIFGPYYVKAHPYPFHDKSEWFIPSVTFMCNQMKIGSYVRLSMLQLLELCWLVLWLDPFSSLLGSHLLEFTLCGKRSGLRNLFLSMILLVICCTSWSHYWLSSSHVALPPFWSFYELFQHHGDQWDKILVKHRKSRVLDASHWKISSWAQMISERLTQLGQEDMER